MIRTVVLIFAIFPFTQIIPLHTYNQPYAVLSAILLLLAFPQALRGLPQLDRLMLVYLLLIGITMFLIAIPNELGVRQIQYLLAYGSPLVIVTALVFVMRSDPDRARRIVLFGILAWVGVALIQRLVSPSFLVFLASESEELAVNVLASGRGNLGLAPEPTHHGLHMLCLGGALMLLRGPLWAVALAFASALLLAMSSFAALVIALGVVLWMVLRPWRWPVLILAGGSFTLLLAYGSVLFEDDSRIGILLHLLNTYGIDTLLRDASSNARIYGIIAPATESLRGFLVPLGMEHSAWIALSDRILMQNPNIYFLSGAGPASGYGLILVQAGVFALPFLAYSFYRLCVLDAATWRGIFPAVAFSVFVGQIYLSTPSFSLVLAAAITAVLLRRDAARQARAAGPDNAEDAR